MKRDLNMNVPQELRLADELLEKYGRWAQDRYHKQRCASAEGKYRPPPVASRDDEPMIPFIADWNARQVQLTLQVVPMQFRRVLFAIYIPQKEHPNSARRRLGVSNRDWNEGRVHGLRAFWSIYSARYLQHLT